MLVEIKFVFFLTNMHSYFEKKNPFFYFENEPRCGERFTNRSVLSLFCVGVWSISSSDFALLLYEFKWANCCLQTKFFNLTWLKKQKKTPERMWYINFARIPKKCAWKPPDVSWEFYIWPRNEFSFVCECMFALPTTECKQLNSWKNKCKQTRVYHSLPFLYVFFSIYRLKIERAVPNDTGNYTCVPTIAKAASAYVHVIIGKYLYFITMKQLMIFIKIVIPLPTKNPDYKTNHLITLHENVYLYLVKI